MLTKIKKVKLETDNKNPLYQALLECPEGNELFIRFDYTYVNQAFMPLEVYYKGKSKGAKLAWYTSEIEGVTVQEFLEEIAEKINKKYGFQLNEQ